MSTLSETKEVRTLHIAGRIWSRTCENNMPMLQANPEIPLFEIKIGYFICFTVNVCQKLIAESRCKTDPIFWITWRNFQ
jgi:hypothetical protein